jgi:hypothetical protein
MLPLLLVLSASAGDPVPVVQRLIERSDLRAAVQRCNKLSDTLASNPQLRELCASAHMGLLGDEGTSAEWSALARKWSGTDVAEMASERAAELALDALPATTDPDGFLRMAAAHPGSAAAARARTRAADTALATAGETNKVMAYRAFRKKFAGTPQATQALEKEAEAALADVAQYDTPIAWRQLRSHYPQLAEVATQREVAAVGRVIAETAELNIPCEIPTATGPDDVAPPQCETIPKEAEVGATWTNPEGYTARARLVGWDGESAIEMSSLQRQMGPAPYASQYAEITVAARGTSSETGWAMVLPVELKRPPDMGFRGYAVQIRVLGMEAVLLPFVVSEAWTDARHRR